MTTPTFLVSYVKTDEGLFAVFVEGTQVAVIPPEKMEEVMEILHEGGAEPVGRN